MAKRLCVYVCLWICVWSPFSKVVSAWPNPPMFSQKSKISLSPLPALLDMLFVSVFAHIALYPFCQFSSLCTSDFEESQAVEQSKRETFSLHCLTHKGTHTNANNNLFLNSLFSGKRSWAVKIENVRTVERIQTFPFFPYSIFSLAVYWDDQVLYEASEEIVFFIFRSIKAVPESLPNCPTWKMGFRIEATEHKSQKDSTPRLFIQTVLLWIHTVYRQHLWLTEGKVYQLCWNIEF